MEKIERSSTNTPYGTVLYYVRDPLAGSELEDFGRSASASTPIECVQLYHCSTMDTVPVPVLVLVGVLEHAINIIPDFQHE